MKFNLPLFSVFWLWTKCSSKWAQDLWGKGRSQFWHDAILFFSTLSLTKTLTITSRKNTVFVNCSHLFFQDRKGLTIALLGFWGHSFIWWNNATALWSFLAPAFQNLNFRTSLKLIIRISSYPKATQTPSRADQPLTTFKYYCVHFYRIRIWQDSDTYTQQHSNLHQTSASQFTKPRNFWPPSSLLNNLIHPKLSAISPTTATSLVSLQFLFQSYSALDGL